MKIDRKLLLQFLGVAFLVGMFFWLVDSLLLLFYFGPNLRLLMFDPPETLWQALFVNISPQTLVTRLGFMLVCLFSGWGVAKYVHLERRAKSRFQSYVTHAPMAVFVADANTHILDVNPTAWEMFGYTREEFLALAIIDVYEPKDATLIQNYYSQLSQESAISIETHPKRKDGSRFDMSLDAVVLPDGNILGFGQDITERISWEKDIAAINAALRKSQAQYELIVEHVHDIVWQFDADLRITYVSPAIKSALGYDVSEVVGEPLRSFMSDDVYNNIMNLHFDNDQAEWPLKQTPVEARLRHKDGHWVDVETMASATFDDGGQCIGYVGVTRDIRQRKQDEMQLKAYAGQLETMVDERTEQLEQAQEQMMRQERLAVVGQIAGGISHELRNPLGVITNAVYYLRNMENIRSDELKEYLAVIESQATKSSKIITDLLDMSRTTSIDREAVDVRTLLSMLAFQFPPPDQVNLQFDIPDALPLAYIDRGQMEQVLGNLVTNAYQAMPDGGTLTLSAKPENMDLCISVKDSGVGIPPENIDKLFEPLFTTKATGIGMGLAICKRLVEANSGSISVESTPGEGTTFIINLPYYA